MTDKTNEAFMAGIESIKDRTLPEGVTVEQIRMVMLQLWSLVPRKDMRPDCDCDTCEAIKCVESLLKQLEPRKDSQ
jgi:hypothetical protein